MMPGNRAAFQYGICILLRRVLLDTDMYFALQS